MSHSSLSYYPAADQPARDPVPGTNGDVVERLACDCGIQYNSLGRRCPGQRALFACIRIAFSSGCDARCLHRA